MIMMLGQSKEPARSGYKDAGQKTGVSNFSDANSTSGRKDESARAS